MRSDEFKGDESAQEALKGMLPPLWGDGEQEQDGSLKIMVGHEGVVHWLEPLIVTQEAAGSSPGIAADKAASLER